MEFEILFFLLVLSSTECLKDWLNIYFICIIGVKNSLILVPILYIAPKLPVNLSYMIPSENLIEI